MNDTLKLPNLPSMVSRVHNSGFFVSRGKGIHPTRTIASHELIFVKEGTLFIREQDRHFPVSAGHSLILFPEREHAGTQGYSPELKFYWVHFDALRAGRARLYETVPQFTFVRRQDRLEELFRWFLADQESGDLQPLQAVLLLGQMLLEVADSRPAHASERAAGTQLAVRAARHLHQHFHEPLSTATLAKALRCNADYLGRVFQKAYGETITDALHRQRLQHARRHLLEGTVNIDEVARASGYTEPGYFRRVFKRYEGMTPGAFRRLYTHMHVNTE